MQKDCSQSITRIGLDYASRHYMEVISVSGAAAEVDTRRISDARSSKSRPRAGGPQLGSKSLTMSLRPSLSERENLAVGIVGGCVETVALSASAGRSGDPPFLRALASTARC